MHIYSKRYHTCESENYRRGRRFGEGVPTVFNRSTILSSKTYEPYVAAKRPPTRMNLLWNQLSSSSSRLLISSTAFLFSSIKNLTAAELLLTGGRVCTPDPAGRSIGQMEKIKIKLAAIATKEIPLAKK